LQRALAAEGELALSHARVAGLEALLQRVESLGRDASGRLASVLGELGMELRPEDAVPSRLSDMISLLEQHLIPARNELGVLAAEIGRLSEEREAADREHATVRDRLRELEKSLAARSAKIPASGESGSRLRVLIALHDFLPRHRGGTEIYAW